MTIQVSNGKGEPVVVPRVTGLTKVEAVQQLEELGLVAAIQFVTVRRSRARRGSCVSQIPIGDGTKVVDAGSTITLHGRPARQAAGDDGGDGARQRPASDGGRPGRPRAAL